MGQIFTVVRHLVVPNGQVGPRGKAWKRSCMKIGDYAAIYSDAVKRKRMLMQTLSSGSAKVLGNARTDEDPAASRAAMAM